MAPLTRPRRPQRLHLNRTDQLLTVRALQVRAWSLMGGGVACRAAPHSAATQVLRSLFDALDIHQQGSLNDLQFLALLK